MHVGVALVCGLVEFPFDTRRHIPDPPCQGGVLHDFVNKDSDNLVLELAPREPRREPYCGFAAGQGIRDEPGLELVAHEVDRGALGQVREEGVDLESG